MNNTNIVAITKRITKKKAQRSKMMIITKHTTKTNAQRSKTMILVRSLHKCIEKLYIILIFKHFGIF